MVSREGRGLVDPTYFRGAVLLVLLGFAASACSGSDELAFSEWQDQVSAVCDEYEPKLDEAEAELGEPESLDDVAAGFDVLIPLNERYTAALVDVGVPSERSDEVEQVYEDLLAQGGRATELGQAIEDGDDEAVGAVAAEMRSESEALDAQAEALGVPECVSRDAPAEEAASGDATEEVDPPTEDTIGLRDALIAELTADGAISTADAECIADGVFAELDAETIQAFAEQDGEPPPGFEEMIIDITLDCVDLESLQIEQ